jgi:hypothetical protein
MAQARLDPDPPAMQLHDSPGDRQAEPGAAFVACFRGFGLLEFLENPGLIGFTDAGTRVLYRDRDRPVAGRGPDRHLSPVGEFDCIAHQVEEDLGELALVAVRPGENTRQARALIGRPRSWKDRARH